MPVRIVLADDHPIVTAGVRQLLDQDNNNRVVEVAASTDELFAALERTPCDVLITDFSMPRNTVPDGLSMLRAIRCRWPELPIIVLSQMANPAIVRAIFDHGVRGFINKADALSSLPQTVASVIRGRICFGHAATALLHSTEAETPSSPQPMLSPREAEVLRLFASGVCVRDIARMLDRSVKTISNQKAAAMAKLGIKADVQIFAYASNHGLIS